MQASTDLCQLLHFGSLEGRFQCGHGALLRQVEVEVGINFNDFGLKVCLVLRAAGKDSLDLCLRVHVEPIAKCGVRLQSAKQLA